MPWPSASLPMKLGPARFHERALASPGCHRHHLRSIFVAAHPVGRFRTLIDALAEHGDYLRQYIRHICQLLTNTLSRNVRLKSSLPEVDVEDALGLPEDAGNLAPGGVVRDRFHLGY